MITSHKTDVDTRSEEKALTQSSCQDENVIRHQQEMYSVFSVTFSVDDYHSYS